MSSYLKDFKSLADSVNSTITSLLTDGNIDYYKVCDYLNIDTTQGYARDWVLDKLHKKIAENLQPEPGSAQLNRSVMGDIHEALVYESVLDSIDNSVYLTLINIITSNQKEFKPFAEIDTWKVALSYAKDYEAFNPHIYTVHHQALRQKYPRNVDVAEAARQLRDLGCGIEIDDVTLKINSGLEAIATGIEENIRRFGAYNVLSSIFLHLNATGKYFPVYNRYLITNEITIFPQQTQVMIPYGFLLNLAIKHPFAASEKLSPTEAQVLLDDITHKAKLLAAVIDLRYYGIFERHFQSVETLPKFVINLALFDSAFAFPSYDVKEIIEYQEQLFHWVNAQQFETEFGFTILEFIEVTKTIVVIAPETGPVIFKDTLVKECIDNIASDRIDAIMACLTHQPFEANKEYQFFTDYDKLDFGFKPLLKNAEGDYLLCDKSWCASAFYEVLATLVRDPDPKRDQSNSKIGFALEKYIYNLLDLRGINYQHGNYADGTLPEGEVDVLIQSAKSIVLIENKKKVLTRRSKTGSDVKLMIDLAGSLLNAHVQTGRTELLLRKQGHIDLIENGKIETITFNNREIERTALTHWDFGSFQDRDVINSLLSIFTTAEIGLVREDGPRDANDFKKIKKKQLLWAAQAAELQKLDPRFDHFPFFNCWFLSLSQLRVILNHCQGNEDFYEVLRSTRHITHGTANYYKEFYFSYIIRHQTESKIT